MLDSMFTPSIVSVWYYYPFISYLKNHIFSFVDIYLLLYSVSALFVSFVKDPSILTREVS